MAVSTSAPVSAAAATAASTVSSVVNNSTIAGNFTTFLQLLTTQLRAQNPLDPLDTNQFTQQLVQFAQVEQQLKSNDQLTALVALQKTSQATAALGFVGANATVDGATAQLAQGQAQWAFSVTKPATADVRISDATGQLVYSGSFTVQPGQQNFVWDGRGSDGNRRLDGAYTISITAKDATGATTAVTTEVTGVVDSVDLTKDPPLLTIGDRQFTLDKIKRVGRS